MLYFKAGKVGFAGDWHGNTVWASTVIAKMADHLQDEKEKIIIQVGDFGFWPGNHGKSFLAELTDLLETLGVDLYFIDGNHENHVLLRKNAQKKGILDQGKPVQITGRITWMPRGSRMMINDKEWLFLGGAASVDRKYRTEGQSWFPEERITDEQADLAISGGPATLLICHDSPANVHINFPPYPVWPEQDIALSHVNRDKIQRVVDECFISYVVHGHMHMSFERMAATKTSSMRVNCLNCDGSYGNWAILNTSDMEWITGG